MANTLCLVEGSFLQQTTPMMTSTWACEFGYSPYAAQGVPAELGDWRPPELFQYTPGSKSAPVNLETLNTYTDDVAIQAVLNQTVGIRSAASAPDPYHSGHKVVFFAGPTMSTAGGINMLAFHDDGTFIGATTLPLYNDIRRWVTVNGSLYTGVGLTDLSGGEILEWTPTPDNYFGFTEVGFIPGDVAELTVAGDELVAGTWPNFASNLQPTQPNPDNEAAVYISPPIDQLTPTSVWQQVWKASDYEPDFATALTYGIGAMAYYDGYVYWGTMHVPGVAAEAELLYQEQMLYMTPTTQLAVEDFLGTNRAFSMYRMNVDTRQIQLLYGDAQLPAFDAASETWQLANNNMGGVSGLYGSSGFGNTFNNYEWSMAVYRDQLYVGTMDWSYLASQAWPQIAAALGLPAGFPNPLAYTSSSGYGADLYRIPSTSSAGQPLSTNGVGNYLNYGVRNMLATDTGTTDTGLYLGMANPMNLATSKQTPPGGWELIDLTTGK